MVMTEPRIDHPRLDGRTETVTKPETAAQRSEALQAAASWWLLEARLRAAVAEETP